MAPEQTHDRWHMLDGLRGMIAVSVLVGHVQYSWLPGSFVFMDTFFMMSGFLITRILFRKWQATGRMELMAFYMRRLRRLLPALWLVVAVVGLAGLVLHRKSDNPGLHLLGAAFYFENWLRAFEIPHDGLLGHTWSLAIEEQFYLLWPLLLLFGLTASNRKAAQYSASTSARHLNPAFWFFTLAATALLCMAWRTYLALNGTSIARLYNGTDMRLDSLALGALLAFIFETSLGRSACRWLGSTWVSTAVLASLWWAAFNVDFRWHSWYAWMQPICTLLSAALIAGFLAMRPTVYLYRVFAHPAMVYLGTVSYGFYLWHYPLVELAREVMQWPPLVILVVCAPATLLLASLSYHWVELPLLGGRRTSAK